jgi:hypothetical protein
MSTLSQKPVVGRVEPLTFADDTVTDLPAKVDSGAYRSSIWATNIHEKDGHLYFTLLGPSSEYYSGKQHETSEFRLVTVENSFGHKQQRYSVFLRVRVGGKLIRSNFTLANRATKTYSALIGRKMLKGRFVVDVSQGQPLNDEEEFGDDSLA